MDGGGARGHAFCLRATTTTSGSSAICSERSEQFNSVIAGLGPPLVVLYNQQPGAAVDTGDLESGDLTCLRWIPPQLINWPRTCPCIDWHQLSLLADTDKSGCSGHQPTTGDFHRSAVLTQHDRRHRSGEDPSRSRRWDGAWPRQLWIALRRPPRAPGTKQLTIPRIAPTLQAGSQHFLRTEHALQSSDSPLDVLVERASPQALTMISQ